MMCGRMISNRINRPQEQLAIDHNPSVSKHAFLNFCAGLFVGAMVFGTIADAGTTSLPKIMPAEQESLQQWQAMRFGMFIHWGPVSLSAREIG